MSKVHLILLTCICLSGCTRSGKKLLFDEVAENAGLHFKNDLKLTEPVNPYTFRNFYNGGGVAIGDINNDGFLDIYLSGNQVDNKLFLNNGDFTFTDITVMAGVACKGSWSTGVSFVDVNADGWLDLYVCKSGPPETPNRHNELFINNGNLTFSERAHEFGLDVNGLSVQAAFFDFDRDSDLDCYLLTNSYRSVGAYDLVPGLRNIPDASGGGNKFFVNEDGRFHDRTEMLGIYHSAIGFGLGITLGDFNQDSWTDIFVSNDFFERDYLYLNQSGHGFVDSLTYYFQSISAGSMGADFADLDNDGISELFVTEMLPDSLHRRKTKTLFESWDRQQQGVQNGYHYQYSRNVLQKSVHKRFFSEIGRFANVAATEWSWGALIFDMDNDGWKDIFVANGIGRDLLDRDYLAFSSDPDNVRTVMARENEAILKLIQMMPTSGFINYAFQNQGDLQFENKAGEWGLSQPALSNGSAYADLDNDGDIDLVVNGMNQPVRLYRNMTDSSVNKSISFRFREGSANTFALGTKVDLYFNGIRITGDNFSNRGFQSGSQPQVTLGVGRCAGIDTIKITWPDNTDSTFYNVASNSLWHIQKAKSAGPVAAARKSDRQNNLQLKLRPERLFTHLASPANDFDREPLLTQMYCNETPTISVSPLGKPEFYVGGGINQNGVMIAWNGHAFSAQPVPTNWKKAEETGSVLYDMDGDHDLDLLFATGGRAYPTISDFQFDRILWNGGADHFIESERSQLPVGGFATSVIRPVDFDRDGDTDLVLGERFDPFSYGFGGGLHFLANDGNGNFKDVTSEQSREITRVGMVTDVAVADVNQDGWQDLVVVGDWMPIIWLMNQKGRFSRQPLPIQTQARTEGWWRCIHVADLNSDGCPDFLLGNQGLNSFAKPGDRLWIADFDANGSIEQIYTTAAQGKHYPVHDRDELTSRIPSLKKRVLKYSDYAARSIDELFPSVDLTQVKYKEVNMLASAMLVSDAKGGYHVELLPKEAQFSSIYSFEAADLDRDGVPDVVAGGNNYLVKPEFGRQDASAAWLFRGRHKNNRFVLSAGESLNVRGQIRDIAYLTAKEGTNFLIFAKHGDELEIYEVHR